METIPKTKEVQVNYQKFIVYYFIEDTTLTVSSEKDEFPRLSSIVTKEISSDSTALCREVDKLVTDYFDAFNKP